MSENEPTLYLKKEDNNDFIYTISSSSLVVEFKSLIMHEFEMSNMGLLHYFLQLAVQQVED